MKKIVSLILGMLMISALCAPAAFAEDEYANAGEMYQAWYETYGYDSYPPYVCGVWSLDGSMENLMIAVTEDEAGEAGKQEILAQIADDSSVQFTYLRYTYAELCEIQEEIIPCLGTRGANGCGVYQTENVVMIMIDENNPDADAFMKEMAEKYGDKVAFEFMNGAFVTTEEVLTQSGRNGADGMLLAAAAVLLLAGGSYVLLRRRRSMAAVTDSGAVEEVSGGMTVRDVENCVREDSMTPSDDLDRRILSRIDD